MNPSLNKTILIVDDEQDVRDTLAEALEMGGYKAVVVSGGAAALKFLNDAEKPALILLDLMMPEMDGFEFMRAKNTISEIVCIPTIVVSASGCLDLKLAGLNVQGYLKKPINLETLLETAERYCG